MLGMPGLLTAGLLLLIYALSRGTESGWGSGTALGLLAASVVMLCAFVLIETRSRSPLVPGSSVRNRTLVAANLSAFFTFGAIIAFIFLGSLLMQQVLGYSPERTGLAWLATTATSVVAAGITGGKLVAVLAEARREEELQALVVLAAQVRRIPFAQRTGRERRVRLAHARPHFLQVQLEAVAEHARR